MSKPDKVTFLEPLMGALVSISKEILNSMLDLQKLIDAEHDYIRKSDLKSLELVTQEKEKISQKIRENITKIERVYGDVCSLAGFLIGDSKESRAPNLSNIAKVFEDLREKLESQGAVFNIELFKSVDKALREVILFQKNLSPKIEMNVYLTSKLLDHHRETYRFWQEIALESSSVYGENGDAKPQTSVPILSIKA